MKKQENTKQMLFEMMGKIDPTFKPKLNEGENVEERYRGYSGYGRDWDSWAREKTAGEYDRGDYYEVENGQLVGVKDYDKWEHGKILGRYNGRGEKVDIETGYPLDEK